MTTGRDGNELRRDTVSEIQKRLHRMEPDLRLLRGAAVLLHTVSESADSVEPVAFEALARLVDEPLERITACWREAFDASRGR